MQSKGSQMKHCSTYHMPSELATCRIFCLQGREQIRTVQGALFRLSLVLTIAPALLGQPQAHPLLQSMIQVRPSKHESSKACLAEGVERQAHITVLTVEEGAGTSGHLYEMLGQGHDLRCTTECRNLGPVAQTEWGKALECICAEHRQRLLGRRSPLHHSHTMKISKCIL